MSSATIAPILLLCCSNVFMTFAWYGQLKWFDKNTGVKIWLVILISWAIALGEYCFQVPANRIGYNIEKYSAAQLKTIQEVITLVVFSLFSTFVLKEPFRWNYLVGFGLLVCGAFFIFNKWE